MQRAGGTHAGPAVVAEHASPSAAAGVHVPVSPTAVVLHSPLARQVANW
jgi:hypothetical protein